jgi:hypothetical protein
MKSGSNPASKSPKAETVPTENRIEEQNLEKMESLLKHSALGVHILFDNKSIAAVLGNTKDDKDFFDFEKMKKVQDSMTALVAKKSYMEKMDFLRALDRESFEMLIRTYFHIVENNVRQASDLQH